VDGRFFAGFGGQDIWLLLEWLGFSLYRSTVFILVIL
jgi:hypothetical protein